MRRLRPLRIVCLSALSLLATAGVSRAEPAKTITKSTTPGAGALPAAAPPGSQPPSPESRSPALTAEASLSRATAFYEAGQYGDCVTAFAVLLGDNALAAELAFRSREQARVYYAACLIAQGKTAAADEQFRAAIRESPQMGVPNAIVFPPPVIEHFVNVRNDMLEEIAQAEEARAEKQREAALLAARRAEAEKRRLATLEHLASEETIITKNRRWVASVPFGVGQFQNRDYGLGWVFLVGDTLLLGTAITAVSIELSLNSQAKGGAGLTNQNHEVDQLNQNLRAAHTVSLVALGGLALAVAGGIVESNLSFVPEFRDGTRKRTKGLPPDNVAPTVQPLQGGASFGVVGRF